MRSFSKQSVILFVLIFAYFIVFSALSVLKHLSLHSSYLDLGLESQVIWNTSQGRIMETSFGPNGELISALSFHVSPVSILLTPLYWIWSNPIILLIFQTAALALGGLPIFWLARKVIGGKLLPFSLLISYLLYPPLQYSNLSDFHPQTLATPIILYSFWFLYSKRLHFFWLSFILGILVKENVSLIYLSLGIYAYFTFKNKALGIIVSTISATWFLLSVYAILPAFSGGKMGALGRYEYLGTNPFSIMWSLISNPLNTLKILIVKPKLMYISHLLISAGLLPLMSPVYLLIAGSEFFLNLFSAYNPQWQIKFHYTAAITPFIFISTVFGVNKLYNFLNAKKVYRPKILIAFYFLAISVLWNIAHSPSPLFYKFDSGVYKLTEHTNKTLQSLSTIPKDASVSAMNNLGAHLSSRRFLYRFPINYQLADYVVVDPTLPLESFDLSQVSQEDFNKYMEKLRQDENYIITTNLERLTIFEKIK